MKRLPFNYDPAKGRKQQRNRRIKAKGLALPSDKEALRAIADAAALSHPIRKLKPGPQPTIKRGQPYQCVKDRIW